MKRWKIWPKTAPLHEKLPWGGSLMMLPQRRLSGGLWKMVVRWHTRQRCKMGHELKKKQKTKARRWSCIPETAEVFGKFLLPCNISRLWSLNEYSTPNPSVSFRRWKHGIPVCPRNLPWDFPVWAENRFLTQPKSQDWSPHHQHKVTLFWRSW